jgi:hypothetical protein
MFVAGGVFGACSGVISPSAESGTADHGVGSLGGSSGKQGAGTTRAGSGGGSGDHVAPEASTGAAPIHIRRLTATEIENSLNDVFRLNGVDLSSEFPPERGRHAYDNLSAGLSVPVPVAEALQTTAERVSELAIKNLPALLPCDPSKVGESTCLTQFFDGIGLRVYRRPVTDAERTRLSTAFAAVRKSADYPAALGTVIEAMIQSPNFLFRTELGGTADADGFVRLDPWETASALSYALWSSAPDNDLLAAARANRLSEASDLEAQARRLLQDPRAHAALRSFFLQWLEVVNLPEAMKDSARFPEFNRALATDMLSETSRFVDATLWSGDGKLSTLLSSPATFANAALAKIYGLQNGPAGADLAPVMLDGAIRGGVLTQPAFLTANTPSSGFSPILIGRFVRTKVFCQALPPPPPNVKAPPEPSANVSTRERFASHESEPACGACHQQMDPIGFGFERLDAIGRYRDTENGKFPLTGQGALAGTDVDGSFTGPLELVRRILRSQQAQDCVAAQFLEYALGRPMSESAVRLPGDDASIQQVGRRLSEASGDLREAFVAAVTSPSFVVRGTRSTMEGARP